MPREKRPVDYPRLLDYKPSPFMLPESHYDKAKADRAVRFIENLRHTKGKWDGKPFWLLPWQEQIIRDIFGIVDEDGNRQFRTAYVEIGKKNGKSELAAAVALYLLYADNEPSAEVYGAAADRQQASIVFDVAKRMVEKSPALLKRSKIAAATKRIVNYSNAGFYQVLSAEVGTKHGLNVSGLVFDEVHAQPNRKLYDVLTKGSLKHWIFLPEGGSTIPSIRWFMALQMTTTGRTRRIGTRLIHPSGRPSGLTVSVKPFSKPRKIQRKRTYLNSSASICGYRH